MKTGGSKIHRGEVENHGKLKGEIEKGKKRGNERRVRFDTLLSVD